MYDIRCSVNIRNTAAGTAYVRLVKNSTTEIPGTYMSSGVADGSTVLTPSAIMPLAANDYVTVQAGVNILGNVSIDNCYNCGTGALVPTTNSRMWCTIVRLQ